MAAGLALWQTLLAGGAGGAFTLAGQWLVGTMQRTTQIKALSHERDLTKEERRDQYELEHLEELRQTVGRLQRQIVDFKTDIVVHEEGGGDPDDAYESKLYRDILHEVEEFRSLSTVILDEELSRRAVGVADDVHPYLAFDRDDIPERVRDLQTLIGDRIRGLYGVSAGGEVSKKYHEPHSGGETTKPRASDLQKPGASLVSEGGLEPPPPNTGTSTSS